MKQKTVLMTAPILLVLVTLSVFALPAAAPPPTPPPSIPEIFAVGKAVMWCKGECYSGIGIFGTDKVTYISILAEWTGQIGMLQDWSSVCSFKLFTLTMVVGSCPDPCGSMPGLNFVIVFICGDRVTLYAFGWGCFLYFHGTVSNDTPVQNGGSILI